jgi:hypothetical protein
MARKSAEPELDYAENTTGTFGSGWTPGVKTGGFPAFKPASQSGTQIAGAAPAGAPVRANDAAVMARISGNRTITNRQSPEQMAAQDDFDRRHGFTPTKRSPDELKTIADFVNPTKPNPTLPVPGSPTPTPTPAPVLKNSNGDVVGTKSPLDAINNPPSIASEPLPSASTELLGVPSGQEVPQATPNAYATQNVARIPGYSGGNPAIAKTGPDIAKLGSGFFGAIKRGAGNILTALNRPATSSTNPMAARPAGGDAIASGVSNATAAQFQKPTKANPVPVTPTTPTANIDRSQESLGRFGYSDDEFNRRKFAFAGF